jgi:hypothetical protein
VVKKTRSDSELHHDPADFEQKTGKAGKGIGPASFVALRVHSWFNLRGAIARRFMASNPSAFIRVHPWLKPGLPGCVVRRFYRVTRAAGRGCLTV